MPPKRKASVKRGHNNTATTTNKKTNGKNPAEFHRKANVKASVIDSEDDQDVDQQEEEEDDDDDEQMEYEIDSDQVSHISSSEDEDDQEVNPIIQNRNAKTVSASNFTFLSGLDKNKSLDIPQHELSKQNKELKKREREQLEEIQRRLKGEKRRRQQEEYDQDEFTTDSDSEEIDIDVGSDIEFEEYSDVSEGENVDNDRQDRNRVKKRKINDSEVISQDEKEAIHLSRLNKRREREELQQQKQKLENKNEKLPIRTLDGKLVQKQDQDRDHLKQDSDGDDDDDATNNNKKSRAIHAPVPVRSFSQTEKELQQRARQNPRSHSSVLHSTRFNLTAPYEIMLIAHPSRLPLASSGNPKSIKKTTVLARSQMIHLAKNQIASLASQVVADPEVSINLLKRLAVFAGATIEAPPESIAEIRAEQDHYKTMMKGNDATDLPPPRPIKISVDPAVRQLALMSILAILVDILPGYRIRALTEKEQQERVGQDVARRREYEVGLVSTYQNFLKLCQVITKDPQSPLQPVAIKCFTTLATRATHFNFRANILQCLVARMSRKIWGPDEESCYQALVQVVQQDKQGQVSLEIVRLIHRMVKERKYKVNSRILDVLVELRLKNELGTKRASTSTASDPVKEAEKERIEKERKRVENKIGKGKAKPQEIRKGLGQHLSKKAVKKRKEIKAIEEEIREAEVTVDLEERETNQTETLKLLFVLYFSILKSPIGSVSLQLLGSALEGLSRFAHRVNVDFFRDLIVVLRQHVEESKRKVISQENRFLSAVSAQDDEDEDNNHHDQLEKAKKQEIQQDYSELEEFNNDQILENTRHALLCLVTTFELLSGQGDVLNIDLSDLVADLYSLLLCLPFSAIEQQPDQHNNTISSMMIVNPTLQVNGLEKPTFKHNTHKTLADLLFRSLDLVLLFPHRGQVSSDRLAAFIKRLSILTLHFPTPSIKRSLVLIQKLISKEPNCTALLDLSDRARDGHYDPFGENPDNSAVLRSGQTILSELIMLQHLGNLEISQLCKSIFALKDRA